MKPITLVLADDHALVREGIRELLQREPDIKVIAEAGNGQSALKKVKRLRPDILLLDILMPRLNGMDVARLIREASIESKIIVLSMYDKRSYIREMLHSGALGYVLKTSPGSELIAAIRTVYKDNYYFSKHIKSDIILGFLQKQEKIAVHEKYELLTQREQQVFRLIAEGHAIREIADILCISPKTVEKHRTNVSKKLNLNTPVAMARYAIKIGIVDTEDWLD